MTVDLVETASGTPELDLVLLFADWVMDPDLVPDAAAEDLRRLLAHDIAAPTTPQLRIGHLGLLIDLINELRRYITKRNYEDERARRALQGEVWPASSALTHQYGPWPLLVDEVTDFVDYGPASKLQRPGVRAPRVKSSYTPAEVNSALIRCRSALGAWPSPWGYELWASIERRVRRKDPNLPILSAIDKTYGDWDTASRRAQRAWRRSHINLVRD